MSNNIEFYLSQVRPIHSFSNKTEFTNYLKWILENLSEDESRVFFSILVREEPSKIYSAICLEDKGVQLNKTNYRFLLLRAWLLFCNRLECLKPLTLKQVKRDWDYCCRTCSWKANLCNLTYVYDIDT